MTLSWVSACQLKQRFAAFGHFYELSSGRRCRSVLELLSHERATGGGDAERGLPDAIFVMMNPGSSKPLRESDWVGDLPGAAQKRLVPARPDTTQYQLMRVMVRMGWEHVRVINLSDLHEAKSSAFVRDYPALGDAAHSIFMPTRQAEREVQLQRQDGAPLVLAWGLNPRLAPLINMALKPLQAAGRCYGVQRQGAYLHPLPRKQEDKLVWLETLCMQLQHYP